MAKIILDFGSGNTCKNNWDYAKRMIDELKAVDTGKHKVVIKWQLFKDAGDNIPLDKTIFDLAYVYAKQLGYQTTASIFDKESLDFLLQFDVPMIKIANNRALDYLIGEIPRKIPVYVSYGSAEQIRNWPESVRYGTIKPLLCVSNYPAYMEDYEKIEEFGLYVRHDKYGISDHTTNFGLWYRYQPETIEWHFGLSDSTGLDSGPFMRTPTMLKEVL